MAKKCKIGRDFFNGNSLQNAAVLLLTVLLVMSLFHLLFSFGSFCAERFESNQIQKRILYVFLMDGCGWCEKFKPELEVMTSKLASDTALKSKLDLKIIKYPTQSSADKQLMKDFSVEAFPSVILSTQDQSKFWSYPGSEGRTAAKILQWVDNV